tara:strand:+ start:54794 stop:56350 length:1557 start_codon:yes stop_codon:yes gene_type:complete
MKSIIKNFKLFKESYSDDLSEVLKNEENKYIVMKGDDILVGFEFIGDCFDHLSELLEGDGAISEEQKYEFDEYVSEFNVENLEDQYEIEEFMTDILDRFEVVEPYKIIMREELEETPVDLGIGDELDSEVDNDNNDNDIDKIDVSGDSEFDFSGLKDELDDDIEDYKKVLGESLLNTPFSIVGDKEGVEEEIEGFDSQEEADEFLEDYKTIYNEYDNVRVSTRLVNEGKKSQVEIDNPELYPDGWKEMDGMFMGPNSIHNKIKENEDFNSDNGDAQLAEWADEQDDQDGKCECCVDGKCTCGDDCSCGSNCVCEECGTVNENWLNTVGDIVGIADPTGLVDLVNGLDYIRQGKYFYGLLSMISIIPYAGDAVAKPIILLAKAGKMKGVVKAMEMAKAGNKAGAVKLLRKGAKESAFGKFLKTAGGWGEKLNRILDEMPGDKIKDDEKSTIKEWISIFVEASGGAGDVDDNNADNNTDNKKNSNNQTEEDQHEEVRTEEKISEQIKNKKIKTFSDFRNI